MLAIPKDYEGDTGAGSVVVAWNGTRESARAVTDALPILHRADRVSVVIVDPSDLPRPLSEVPGSDICQHLSRHGVHAQAQVIDSGERSVGSAIVEWVRAQDAQMIVMGAFGHWRVRELVLGGATREVLRETHLPVLMSH